MRIAILTILAICGGCRDAEPVGSEPPRPYRGPPADTPTNQLRATASTVEPVLTSPDSLLIRYRLRNEGPTRNVGDFPISWSFRVFTPEGLEIRPRWTNYSIGWGGHTRAEIARGQLGEEHIINLACTEPERFRFGAEFKGQGELRCQGWTLPSAGDYYVLVQHIPLFPPNGENQGDPVYLASRADTVLLRYRPTGEPAAAPDAPRR